MGVTVARRVWLAGVAPCPTARWGGGLGTPQSGWHGNAQPTALLRRLCIWLRSSTGILLSFVNYATVWTMNTPSHFLINYSVGRLLRLPQRYAVKMSAVVWGSLAPDVMLYVLSITTTLYFRVIHGWSVGYAMDYGFDTLFFENIWWIVLHNVMQAPLVLVGAMVVAMLGMRTARGASNERMYAIWLWVVVFLASALLHTILDIFTHHDDGPLLLFPFNFDVRFRSPVSYWDPQHFGNIFYQFELLVDVLCVGYLGYLGVRRMKRRNAARK